MNRRQMVLISAAAMLLGACSGPYMVSSEVASFGSWPAERPPGSYFFERLPSQQMGKPSEQQLKLEAAAAAALAKAGFKPAADARSADVLVSLGMTISAQDLAPWDDPLWWRWHGSYRHWRYGGWPRSTLMIQSASMWERRYERNAALLLRDRQTAEPLYEARASNDGMSQGDEQLTAAMFEAALSDFPKVKPEPHRVAVQIQR